MAVCVCVLLVHALILSGDYALPREAMECIRLMDVDGDGRIGLWDYINFAARLKELHQVSIYSTSVIVVATEQI